MIIRLNPTACVGSTAGAVGRNSSVSPVEPYRIGSRSALQHPICLCRKTVLYAKLHTGRVAQPSALKISAVATIDHGSTQPLTPRIPSANQIFDSQHVPHLSSSLLLYFPLGACLFRSVLPAVRHTSRNWLTLTGLQGSVWQACAWPCG